MSCPNQADRRGRGYKHIRPSRHSTRHHHLGRLARPLDSVVRSPMIILTSKWVTGVCTVLFFKFFWLIYSTPALWSLEFAISVFVVACPCGIDLAAKYGIPTRCGGGVFQEMAQVDVVVFDKTGMLTEGGQPQVSDFEVISRSTWTSQTILRIAAGLESASSHPLGTTIKDYATKYEVAQLSATGFHEVAGCGMTAHFEALGCTAPIQNEAWTREYEVALDSQTTSKLAKWTSEAKIIVLVAIRTGRQPERPHPRYFERW